MKYECKVIDEFRFPNKRGFALNLNKGFSVLDMEAKAQGIIKCEGESYQYWPSSAPGFISCLFLNKEQEEVFDKVSFIGKPIILT